MFEINVENTEQEQILEDTVQISVNQFQNIYLKYGNSSINYALEKLEKRLQFLQEEYNRQKELNDSLHNEFIKLKTEYNIQIKELKKLKFNLIKLINSK